MNWNKFPYWLKGGIIFLSFSVTCTIIFALGDWRAGQIIDWLMVSTLMPFAFGGFFVGGISDILIGLTEQYIFYFSLGSVLGYFYGKIKT